MKFISGMMTPEMNCAFQPVVEQLSSLISLNWMSRIPLAAEGLDDHVTRVHLLDVAVEFADALLLSGEDRPASSGYHQ